MDAQLTINDFIRTFKPDLNRYVMKDSRGNVTTVKRPLAKELMVRFFSDVSSCRLSFFVRGAYRNYIGLDIDDHEYGGWVNDAPTEFLRKKFTDVINEIGAIPSAIFRSPRGIHAFWFLTKSLPNKVIEDSLKTRFESKNLSVEILPTAHHALAIPRPMEYLDYSLKSAMFPGYSNVAICDPITILGQACLPDRIIQNYKSGSSSMNTKKGGNRSVKTIKDIEDMEAKYLPLENGRSNETYKYLVGFYKARGLNYEQIVERFRALVAKSPGYSGDLLRGIENRVASSYRNLKGMMVGTMETGSPSILWGEPKIQWIIGSILAREGIPPSEGKRMRDAHIKYILHLFCWIRSYDLCQADYEQAAYWNFVYPNSLWYYKEGYYPLSHRRWNVHYDRHLRLLKEHGILVESPFGYSTTLKRCKYYKITIDIKP